MLEIDVTERIESVKAGCLGAASAAATYGISRLGNHWLLDHEGIETFLDSNLLPLLASWAIAALSGFLFGVTYRYVIRQDQNPHLKSGAVLAFGLVRGLAQLETLPFGSELLPSVVLVLESILIFAVARLLLDQAIELRWLKPFQ